MAYGTLLTDTIKSSTSGPVAFQNTSGTEIGTLCRAWVNFNGSSGSVRASFNVTSVTRGGTGQYTVNFTNALSDANYALVGCLSNFTSNAQSTVALPTLGTPTTTSCPVYTEYYSAGGTYYDPTYVYLSFFR